MGDGESAACKADESPLHGGQEVGGVDGGGEGEAEGSLDYGGERDPEGEADTNHRRSQENHALRDEYGQGRSVAGGSRCIEQAQGKPRSHGRGDGGGDDDRDNNEEAPGTNGKVDEQARERNGAEDRHKVEELVSGVHGESKDPGDGKESRAGERDNGMAGAEETVSCGPKNPGFLVGKVDISGSETRMSMAGQLASGAGSLPSHSTTLGAEKKLAAAQSSALEDSFSSQAGGGQAGVRLALKLVRAIGETTTAEEHRKAVQMLDRLCVQDAVSFSSEGEIPPESLGV